MAGKSLIDRAVALFGSREAAARAAGISGYSARQASRGELSGDRRASINAGLRSAIDSAKGLTGGKTDPIARAVGSVSKSALSEATGLKRGEVDRAARGSLRADERARVEKSIAKFADSKAGRQALADASIKGKAIDRRGLQSVPAIAKTNAEIKAEREENGYRKIEEQIGVPWEVIKDIHDQHREMNAEFTAIHERWKRAEDGKAKDKLYKKMGDLADRMRNIERSTEFQAVVAAGLAKDEYMFSHDGEIIEEQGQIEFTSSGKFIREGD